MQAERKIYKTTKCKRFQCIEPKKTEQNTALL